MLPVMISETVSDWANIALRRFLHKCGNIAIEGSPKPGLCPMHTLMSNDPKSSL